MDFVIKRIRGITMKALLQMICLVGLVTSVPAMAQITITENDVTPLIGSVHTSTTYSAVPTAGSNEFQDLQNLGAQVGGNQTFNLVPFTYDAPDALTYTIEAITASTPDANNPAFAGAEFVQHASPAQNPGLPGDNYVFNSIDAAGYYIHGNTAPGLSLVTHTPAQQDLALPLTMGTTWSTSFTRVVLPAAPGGVDIDITSVVDGWGTLVTPAGSAPCLSILVTQTTTINGTPLPANVERLYVTREGLQGRIGKDPIFNWWESVSYSTHTGQGGTGEPEDGVLLVVDNALSLSDADAAVYDLLVDLQLEVVIKSDNEVTTDDAAEKDLIVVSASVDASTIAADFSGTAVPLITWEAELYDDLLLTGATQGTDYGTTSSVSSLSLLDATHPIANGASGETMVYSSAAPMAWGTPGVAARLVAEDNSGGKNTLAQSPATIFTYETGDDLVGGGSAPARRVGFFMDEQGPANATTDGTILLRNAILWALGLEANITQSVDVEKVSDEIPLYFDLGANYPNPFNPSTSIPFSLAEQGHVRLTVYNLLGQQVGHLVDMTLPVGTYTYNFDASDLPSGIYTYRLQVNHDTESKRMLLLK